MPGEALGIIRIQAAKCPSGRVEPAVVRAIVIPGRRILMDHRILLAGLCRHKDPSAITTRAPCTVQDPFSFLDLRSSVRVRTITAAYAVTHIGAERRKDPKFQKGS